MSPQPLFALNASRSEIIVYIVPSYEGTNSSIVPSYEGTVLLGGFYRLHWRACVEVIAVDVKDFEIFCCPHFEKKSDIEIKS